MLTPERSIEIQGLLGSDIEMQLDECVQLPAADDARREGDAAVAALGGALHASPSASSPGKALFGIVQGGDVARAARRERARRSSSIDFDGYAIGGLAVGEPQEVMLRDDRDGRAAPAGGPAALPDGRRHAGRYRRGGARAASTCSTA